MSEVAELSPESQASLERGLKQAKEGKVSDGPESLNKKLKKVLKIAKKAAKTAAKAEKSKTEKKSDEPAKKEPSVRERIFRLLAKAEYGFTRQEVMTKLGIRDCQNVFADEGLREKPRIKRAEIEGVRGMVYALTAAGRKAIEQGTIDSDRAPSSLKEEKKYWKDGLLAKSGRPRGKKKNKVATK